MKTKNKVGIYAGVLLIIGIMCFPVVSAKETQQTISFSGEGYQGSFSISSSAMVTIDVTVGTPVPPPDDKPTLLESHPLLNHYGKIIGMVYKITYYYDTVCHMQVYDGSFGVMVGDTGLLSNLHGSCWWHGVYFTVTVTVNGCWDSYHLRINENVDYVWFNQYDWSYSNPPVNARQALSTD
jgi:hypothetical protein